MKIEELKNKVYAERDALIANNGQPAICTGNGPASLNIISDLIEKIESLEQGLSFALSQIDKLKADLASR